MFNVCFMNDNVDFLLKLLSFNGNNIDYKPDIECVRFCSQELEKLGFDCDFQIFEDVANLYAILKKKDGKPRKTLCFAGHCDVVAKGNNWNYNSCGQVVGNKIYGRGTVDMLGGVACFFGSIKKILQEKPEILDNINLSVLLTGDEEDKCINGTNKMIDYLIDRGEKFDWCILAEPSCNVKNIDTDKLNSVMVSNGGSLLFRIKVLGKSAHVANLNEFDNPVQKGTLLCQKLKELSYVDSMTNLEILGIEAQNKNVNVILDKAEIFGNVRFFQETSNDIAKKIENICKKICGKKYELRIIVEREGWETNKKSKFINIITNVIKNYNPDFKFRKSRGVSDGEYIKRICPDVCEFGLKGNLAHQPNEYTSLQDMRDLIQLYYKIILQCCKLN